MEYVRRFWKAISAPSVTVAFRPMRAERREFLRKKPVFFVFNFIVPVLVFYVERNMLTGKISGMTLGVFDMMWFFAWEKTE